MSVSLKPDASGASCLTKARSAGRGALPQYLRGELCWARALLCVTVNLVGLVLLYIDGGTRGTRCVAHNAAKSGLNDGKAARMVRMCQDKRSNVAVAADIFYLMALLNSFPLEKYMTAKGSCD